MFLSVIRVLPLRGNYNDPLSLSLTSASDFDVCHPLPSFSRFVWTAGFLLVQALCSSSFFLHLLFPVHFSYHSVCDSLFAIASLLSFSFLPPFPFSFHFLFPIFSLKGVVLRTAKFCTPTATIGQLIRQRSDGGQLALADGSG